MPRIWRIADQNTSITGASLPELGGLEYFNELWIADNKNLAFEKVSELGKLKALRILDVSYSTMNIAGLKNIAKLPQMNFLLLNNIPLHAADLQPLKECKMLRVLSLSDVKGLEFPVLFSILAEFPSLDEVDLGNVDLAGSMLEGVSKIIKLRRLYLANNLLTDESLAPLAQIGPSFNSIDIANNKITGPGLKNLVNLPGIRDLQISDNPLTDEAVTNLGQMKNLEWLWIHNTKISEAGFRDLQAALPKCHIEH